VYGIVVLLTVLEVSVPQLTISCQSINRGCLGPMVMAFGWGSESHGSKPRHLQSTFAPGLTKNTVCLIMKIFCKVHFRKKTQKCFFFVYYIYKIYFTCQMKYLLLCCVLTMKSSLCLIIIYYVYIIKK